MNKEQISHILERLDFWISQSDKWQKSMKVFCETVAPSSYSPIIEDTYTQAYIDGVSEGNPALKNELEYYAYELQSMKPPVMASRDGKEYDLKNRDDLIRWIFDSIS